jgi:hypothetical protein
VEARIIAQREDFKTAKERGIYAASTREEVVCSKNSERLANI